MKSKNIGVIFCLLIYLGLSIAVLSCDDEDTNQVKGSVSFGANYDVINCASTATIYLDGENIGTLENPIDTIYDCGEEGTLFEAIATGEHSYKIEIRPEYGNSGCIKDITGTFTVSENECKKIFIDYSQIFKNGIMVKR